MVQVIFTKNHRVYGDIGWSGDATTGHCTQAPIIHIHSEKRDVDGNGIDITIKGEMRIAAGEVFYAREIKLNTIQVLNLTPEIPTNNELGYMAQKFIYHKGEFDNYGSIDIYDDDGVWQGPGVGPSEGSVWLDFEALGE